MPAFLIRVTEPYVREVLKEIICKKKSAMKNKYAEQSLDSFVNSAMNIEFVYIILKGINYYMDLAIERTDGVVKEGKSFRESTEKTKYGEHHIEID